MGDVKGLELIVFHLVDQMDLSVHVESSIPEHLKTLKLKLYKETEPDSPVYTIKLDTLAGTCEEKKIDISIDQSIRFSNRFDLFSFRRC